MTSGVAEVGGGVGELVGRRVVVVGGGVGGLVTAWDLARRGQAVTVLERDDTWGGSVGRHDLAGLTLDAGAESFATATPAVADLIADLGLADQIVEPNPAGAWVRNDRGTAPLPAGGLLGIPGRPWAPDVRAALGWAGALRAAADPLLPSRLGARSTTLGQLVRARMGSAAVSRLVEPVAGGVYSTHPDELELATVNPRLLPALADRGSLSAAVRSLRSGAARPGSAVAGLRGGMFRLVDALLDRLKDAGVELRTGARVHRLSGGERSWTVRTDGTEPIKADAVVLATTTPETSRLLGELGGDLPDICQPMTEIALVTLIVDEPALDAYPRGTGLLVSSRARGVAAKALTHATAKWAWLADLAGPGSARSPLVLRPRRRRPAGRRRTGRARPAAMPVNCWAFRSPRLPSRPPTSSGGHKRPRAPSPAGPRRSRPCGPACPPVWPSPALRWRAPDWVRSSRTPGAPPTG